MQCVIWVNMAWWLLASTQSLHSTTWTAINNTPRREEGEPKTMSWWIFAVQNSGEKFYYLLQIMSTRKLFNKKKSLVIKARFSAKLNYSIHISCWLIFLCFLSAKQHCACEIKCSFSMPFFSSRSAMQLKILKDIKRLSS